MRITYLLDDPRTVSSRNRRCLADASALGERGHRVDVAVLATTASPPTAEHVHTQVVTADGLATWLEAQRPDTVVVTSRETMAAAVAARAPAIVAWCDSGAMVAAIGAAHGRGLSAVITPCATITTELARTLDGADGLRRVEIGPWFDERAMYADERAAGHQNTPVRIGVFGDDSDAIRDLTTAYEALDLARRAGLELVVVRVRSRGETTTVDNASLPIEDHGPLTTAQRAELLRGLDVFLGTSRGGESAPSCDAIEAMACGVPTVLADAAEYRGFSNRQYTLFADIGDASQFAEALVIVARHGQIRADLRTSGLDAAATVTTDRDGTITKLENALAAAAGLIEGSAPPVTAAPPVPGPIAAALTSARSSPAHRELDALRNGIVAALRETADLERQHGLWDRAAQSLAAAIALAPDDPDLLQRHGHAAYLAGDDRAALASFDRLVDLGGSTTDLHHNRGLVLFSLGELDRAAESLNDALRAVTTGVPESTVATVHNDLGVIRHRVGDTVGANQEFERALQVDPGFEDARNNLAQIRPAANGPNVG